MTKVKRMTYEKLNYSTDSLDAIICEIGDETNFDENAKKEFAEAVNNYVDWLWDYIKQL